MGETQRKPSVSFGLTSELTKVRFVQNEPPISTVSLGVNQPQQENFARDLIEGGRNYRIYDKTHLVLDRNTLVPSETLENDQVVGTLPQGEEPHRSADNEDDEGIDDQEPVEED